MLWTNPLGPTLLPSAAIRIYGQEGPVSGEFSSELTGRLHGWRERYSKLLFYTPVGAV